MAERLFVDISPQGTLVAPTAQARASLARRSGRWVLMPSATSMLLLSQWEGPDVPAVDGAERALLMGEMGGIGLLDLLGLLSQTRRSLRIVVSRGRTERAILLRDGDIASVASSDAHDRLGEFLVRIGKLSAAQLQDALNTAQQTGRKLGQHLVASGMLNTHELWSAIQQQIMEIICDVVAWTDGTYAIFSLPEHFAWPQTPPLATQGLVLEAVRRADEMALFRNKVPSFDSVVLPSGKMPRDCSPGELAALQAIQGGLSLKELGKRLQKGEFDVTKLAYQLVTKGALTVGAAPEPVVARAPIPAGVPASFAAPVAVPAPVVANAGVPPTLAIAAPDLLGVFSGALREIGLETRRHQVEAAYRQGLQAFLADRGGAYQAVFAGVGLEPDGDVDPALVMSNASRTGVQDPARAVLDAMNELTFFALFQASELLDPRTDEELARRVRQILSVLPR